MQWTGYFLFFVLLAAICWPFEKVFPRLQIGHLTWSRTFGIFGIAVAGLFLSQIFSWWIQQPLINVLVKVKLFSLAKQPIPDWALIVLSVLILDFLYYLAHVTAHRFRPLWNLHKIHHSDEHVTALSGLLHHPLESLYIAFFILGFAVLFGVPVLIYFYYGIALGIHGVLSHADVAVPRWLDRILRLVIVTPDLHRTHHSQDMAEGNSNFGAILTIWDRLFGTYIDMPKEPLERLSMGLPEGAKPKQFSAKALLLFPFR